MSNEQNETAELLLLQLRNALILAKKLKVGNKISEDETVYIKNCAIMLQQIISQ